MRHIRIGVKEINKCVDIDAQEYFTLPNGEQMNIIERFSKIPLKYRLGFCYLRIINIIFVCVVFVVCYNEFAKIDLCVSSKQILMEIIMSSPYIYMF